MEAKGKKKEVKGWGRAKGREGDRWERWERELKGKKREVTGWGEQKESEKEGGRGRGTEESGKGKREDG